MERLPRRGEVIFMRFPLTDLSGSKRRPAVVLQPLRRRDMIICQVSSKAYNDPNALRLEPGDFVEGGLPLVSYVQVGKLFTGNDELVTRHVGQLSDDAINKMTERLVALIRGSGEAGAAEGGLRS